MMAIYLMCALIALLRLAQLTIERKNGGIMPTRFRTIVKISDVIIIAALTTCVVLSFLSYGISLWVIGMASILLGVVLIRTAKHVYGQAQKNGYTRSRTRLIRGLTLMAIIMFIIAILSMFLSFIRIE